MTHNALETVDKVVNEIKTTFDAFTQWEDRYRFLMKTGKNLSPFPEQKKIEQYQVKGCESQVWLTYELRENNQLLFQATSDARIIKGLIWLILSPVNVATSTQIAEFDFEAYFNSLGLLKHLSPSRGNGIITISEQIKEIAKQRL